MDDHDHRSIGNRLDLFHFQEDAPGMVFWHLRGLAIVRELEEASRRHVRREGYQEVRSPQVLRQAIWERSGHWEHFREHMFVLEDDDGPAAALKPVSCPAHLEIARRRSLSYRDLPLRLSELGVCHRDEQSGALAGLFRLRQFVQDDGHVFCSEDRVVDEVARFCRSIGPFYRAFGFEHVAIALAGRPASRFGDEERWDRAERALREGAEAAGLRPELVPGGGAFYGPKLELSLVDRVGRAWQCGTIQLDFFLPERFDLAYVDAGGSRRRPAMLHRALFGSLERFLAIVLEHHEGRLPPWLSPEQVRVLPLRPEHAGAAGQLAEGLRDQGIRADVDPRDGGLSRRVALAHADEVPFVLVLGQRELEGDFVDVRSREGRREIPRGELPARLAEALRPPV
jgi:threonyl-tRNA synthetase